MNQKNALGDAIRLSRGVWSLREYAKKCGISHTHLDSIEKGYDPRTGKPVNISFEVLEKLSAGTGLSLMDLAQLLMDQNTTHELKNPTDAREIIGNITEKWTNPQTEKRLPVLLALNNLSDDETVDVLKYIKRLQTKRDKKKGDDQ